MRARSVFLVAVQVGETNHERRAEKLEKKLARYAIMPILQAEEDRRSGPQHCTVHAGSKMVKLHLVCLGCVPSWLQPYAQAACCELQPWAEHVAAQP